MLNIKTIKNFLIKNDEKAGYCFKSSTNQVLTQKQLAQEFAKYNSTITEPDALSMLHILNTIVTKYVALGYDVELPFCNIRLKATGTCNGIQESFQPGAGNNKFSIVVNFSPDAMKAILQDVEYVQLKPGNTTDPQIYTITAVDNHQKEKESDTFEKGSVLRIRGNNLSIDLNDEAQGVFLKKGDASQTKIETYNRIGSNIIDVVIPLGIDDGQYYVVVNAKPGKNRYKNDQASDPITVTSARE